MLGRPPNRIDLVTEIDGISFADAWINCEKEEVDGVKVNFISLRDLIQNTSSTGCEKDEADVRILSNFL